MLDFLKQNDYKLHILSGGYIQEPATIEGVKWETTRVGEPSTLTFTVIKDDKLSFSEGAEVTFRYKDVGVFSGYVFEKRRNKDHHIQVTCFDRTRYLRNKANYVMSGVRADQVVMRIAQDRGLRVGKLTNTGYVIPKLAAQDSTMFDVIQDALDQTMMATGELYCLYDDFGSLTLKHMKEMITDLLITNDTAEDFDYTTSLEGNTANQIVVTGNDGNTTVVNDKKSQKQWGVLQYTANNQGGGNSEAMAKTMLSMYNQVTRSLSIKGAFGDIRVRGGSSVFVHLNLGDHICKQSMLVSRATHTFDNAHHSMELTLIDGRGFYA